MKQTFSMAIDGSGIGNSPFFATFSWGGRNGEIGREFPLFHQHPELQPITPEFALETGGGDDLNVAPAEAGEGEEGTGEEGEAREGEGDASAEMEAEEKEAGEMEEKPEMEEKEMEEK